MFGVGHRPKVVGVDAPLHPAEMVYLDAAREVVNMEDVREPMGASDPLAVVDETVALAVHRPRPQPAPVLVLGVTGHLLGNRKMLAGRH